MEERPWTKSEFFAWSDGRRIVDLYELSKQLHCKQCSSLLDLRRTEREARYGLASVLYILCNCGVINDVHTGRTQQGHGNSPNPMYEVNIKASINLLMYGAGASRILSFLALLDIPVPHPDDTSLIVPVTEDAEMQSASPSVLPTTTTTATSPAQPNLTLPEQTPFQKPQPSSSFIPDPGFSSVPQPPPPEDDDDNEDALHIAENEDGEEVNDNQNDDNDDGDDEEYVPPSKVQSKPSQMSKRKSLLRGPKSARAKQAAKLAAQKRATKARIKVKIKKEKVETPKKAADEVAEVEVESGGKEFANPMEWSSSESDTESAGAKDSDASWHEEEEEDVKEEEEERPKRKRGRPKGSPDKAKRARKSGYKTKKEPVAKVKKGRVQGEAKDVPKCTACSKDFSSIKGYNVHMKRVHNQEMKESVERETRGPLESSVPEPVDAELFVCSFCNQPFARDYTALSHIKHKHWSPTLQPRECFVTMQLRNTLMRVPTTKAKVHGYFSCVLCGSTMSREPTAGHICISPEGTLKCINTCPEGKKLLYTEMNYLFTDKQGYLCDTCGDVFKVPVHLDTHLLKVHGQMTERHKRCRCDICGCTFSLPSHVKKHIIQKHSADGPAQSYMCDICGKEYDRLDSMMTHKRRHHTEGKRFQCEHCPKKFYGRAHWLTHTKQHFGASQHVCPVCNQQFSSNYCLKVHQRKHTGEKPYKCQHCDAAFAQKTSLDVHMKKHQKSEAVSNTSFAPLTGKQSNAQGGRKSDPASFERSDPIGFERSSPAGTGRSDPVLFERSDSARFKRSDHASFERSDSTRLERSNFAGFERLDPARLERLDPENFERLDPTRFERSDLSSAKCDRLDPASLERSEPARLEKSDPAGFERSNLARFENPDLTKHERSEVGGIERLYSGKRERLDAEQAKRLASSSAKRAEFEGSEGGYIPLGYRKTDSQGHERSVPQGDGRWGPQGYSIPDIIDGRRFDPSGDRRLDSREDSRSEPPGSSQPSAYSAGASQIVFPSFYPGSSYYY